MEVGLEGVEGHVVGVVGGRLLVEPRLPLGDALARGDLELGQVGLVPGEKEIERKLDRRILILQIKFKHT